MKEGIIIREKCPICYSASSKSIFNRHFNEDLIKNYMNEAYQGNADIGFLEDVRFEVVKCNRCSLSYQKYVLNEGRLSELYDKWIDPKLAQEWNENAKAENRRFYSFILNYVKKHLKSEPDKIKILDYGAGFGDSLLLAKEMGFDSSAFEYSTERIKFLRSKGITVIDDKNEMLFDFVLVEQVLEHLTYPNEILRSIISKLNKNGLLYIGVPNCSRLEKDLEKTENISDAKEFKRALQEAGVGAFQHINYFTNSNLRFLFKSHRLKPVFPFKQALIKPLSIKSLIRPFYRYYFETGFFLMQ